MSCQAELAFRLMSALWLTFAAEFVIKQYNKRKRAWLNRNLRNFLICMGVTFFIRLNFKTYYTCVKKGAQSGQVFPISKRIRALILGARNKFKQNLNIVKNENGASGPKFK